MRIKTAREIPVGSSLFLAEGNSEVGFISSYLRSVGLDNPILCIGGIDKLGTVLKSISGVPGFDRIKSMFIMLDADQSAQNRIQSLTAIFGNVSLTIDGKKIENGEICCIQPCKIGIYVSPDNTSSGAIEDMVIGEIATSSLADCLKEYTNCAEIVNASSLSRKSVVQIYSSTLDGSFSGTGRAFEKNVFDIRHDAYEKVRNLMSNVLS